MQDLDDQWPALLQLRQIDNLPEWMCRAQPPGRPQIPLFYTPALGALYPCTKPLYWLEKITQGPVQQIFLFWLPLWITLMYHTQPLSLKLFATGLGTWTFMEYYIHRYVFHNQLCFRYLPELVFCTHFVHHKQPHDYTRLCAPLILSLPISSLIVYVCYYGIFRQDFLSCASFLCGLALGYILYDLMHFLTHYTRPFLSMQLHHLAHHIQCHKKYGFTSKIWDKLFGTA